MTAFSDWINSYGLLDLHLNGASFMWSNNQVPPIMSRLDRFLISGEWAETYPQVVQVALPKPTSDRGPKPFRFELMWLEEKNFHDLIWAWWVEMDVQGWGLGWIQAY